MEFIRQKREEQEGFSPVTIKVEKRKNSSFSALAQTLINIVLYLGAYFIFLRQNMQYMGMFLVFMVVSVLAQLIYRFVKSVRRTNRFPYFEILTGKKVYTRYLQGLECQLIKTKTAYEKHLKKRFYSPKRIKNIVENSKPQLWERLPHHSDFLCLTLGTAFVTAPVTVEYPSFSYDEKDEQLEEFKRKAKDILEETTEEVPFVLDLRKHQSLSIVSNSKASLVMWFLLNAYILELAALHAAEELTLAVLFSPEMDLYWTRFLPHVWEGKHRFVQDDASKAEEFLRTVLSSAVKTGKHMVIVAELELLQNTSVYAALNSVTLPSNISVIFFSRLGNSASRAKKCLYLSDDSSGISATLDGTECSFSMISDADAAALAKTLFRTKLVDNKVQKSADIPSYYSYLTMFEEHQMAFRATAEENARICHSFPVAVGVGHDKKLVTLDLSEFEDGPHCLILGTTGSGKSEFLQSYLLSACLKYSPEYFSFVMIDFKGGTVSGKTRAFPHFAGDFINEDMVTKRHLARILTMLSSEISYRTKLLKEAHCDKLYDYHQKFARGEVQRALPLLLVMVDEVAEFFSGDMQSAKEIERLARVGRSFGIHLMLATQAETGAIQGQMQANINARVNFFRADKGENPQPIVKGRAYISSYSKDDLACQVAISATRDGGANYLDIIKLDGSSRMYQDTFKSTQFVRFAVKLIERWTAITDKTPQREVLTKTLEAHFKDNPHLRHQLLSLSSLQEGFPLFKKQEKLALLGMADDVYRAKRTPFYLPVFDGNTMIFGLQKTGKTALLKTCITAITDVKSGLTPQEIGIYIATKNPQEFESYRFPQVASVLKNHQTYYLLLQLLAELYRRREAGSEIIFPHILAIFDGVYEDMMADEEQKAMLQELSGECLKFGISLMITRSTKPQYNDAILPRFAMKFAFFMGDDFDYSMVLHLDAVKEIPAIAGRFLASGRSNTMEVQCAQAHELSEEEIERQAYNYTALWGRKERQKPIPAMPEQIKFSLNPQYKQLIPLGLSKNLHTKFWDSSLSNSLYISYTLEEEKNSLANYIISYLMHSNRKLLLVENAPGCFGALAQEKNAIVVPYEPMILSQSAKLAEVISANTEPCLYVIHSLSRFTVDVECMEILREKIDTEEDSLFLCSDLAQQCAVGRINDHATRTVQLLENRNSAVLLGASPSTHDFGKDALPLAVQNKQIPKGFGLCVTPYGGDVIKLAKEVFS